MRRLVLVAVLAGSCGVLRGQQATGAIGGIGSVASEDATVTGNLSVTNGRTLLVGNSSVTAKDHTAEIALERGGVVRVCATSGVHLTQSTSQPQGAGEKLLLLTLDRGAMERHGASRNDDTILTPDLRIAVQVGGPLDLRLRVTRNGDTCVENKGVAAPVLNITDAFSDAIYQVRPGQHVLFEHGSLKEVVDHESSPCGCPEPTTASGVSVAEALLAPGTPAAKAEAEHPFPAAVSQGLAPAPPVPQATPGETHVQVATTLGYAGDGSGSVAGMPAPIAPVAVQPSTPPPAAAPATGFRHRVGHFFRRLFGG